VCQARICDILGMEKLEWMLTMFPTVVKCTVMDGWELKAENCAKVCANCNSKD
jgi:hypothetical protein